MRRMNKQTRYAKQIGALAKRNAVEWKNTDTNASLSIASGVAVWSALQVLNNLAQGVNNNQRIGRHVVMTKLTVRWQLQNGGGTQTQAPFRMMVVYDRNPQGVLPSITDILTVDQINGQVQLGNSDRFMILKDWYPMKDQGYSAQAGGLDYADKFTLNFGSGLQTSFLSTGGTITDISTGAIYLAFCATNRSISTAGLKLDFIARVRYSDL